MTTKLKLRNAIKPGTLYVEPAHHYFGSTAFNWARGQSRREVIEKLARAAGKDTITHNVKANGGLYCWTCRVAEPQDAEYGIEDFTPVSVKWDGGVAVRIQDAKGNCIVDNKAS